MNDQTIIKKAVEVLKNGGVIVYPTDTIYGFGVDSENDFAVKKLMKIKGRPGPWSIAVCDKNMLQLYGSIFQDHIKFCDDKLPGPNTLILKSINENISKYLLGPNNSIGVRIPDHNIPIKITRLLGRGITSTSVNKTNMKPINDPKKINEQFLDEVDLIIDKGKINNSKPSNIFNLTSKKIIQIR
tara:strand:+ start:290 stop:844 length:555 start_codon:yes stop_codon:yes gene_type:complete